MNNDLYFKDCFTEIEEEKVNAKFNKTTMKCFDSEDNKFSMDCEGNLVVNSIISRENNNLETDFNAIYPVGSIYMSVSQVNPSTLFGGTWEAWGSGRVPVGVDESQEEFKVVEKNGGSKFMQRHKHMNNPDVPNTFGYAVMTNEPGAGLCNSHNGANIKEMYNTGYPVDADTGNCGNLQPYITCYMWKRIA